MDIYVLSLRQHSDDFCVQVGHNVHIARVRAKVPKEDIIRQVRGPWSSETRFSFNHKPCQNSKVRNYFTLLCI